MRRHRFFDKWHDRVAMVHSRRNFHRDMTTPLYAFLNSFCAFSGGSSMIRCNLNSLQSPNKTRYFKDLPIITSLNNDC